MLFPPYQYSQAVTVSEALNFDPDWPYIYRAVRWERDPSMAFIHEVDKESGEVLRKLHSDRNFDYSPPSQSAAA